MKSIILILLFLNCSLLSEVKRNNSFELADSIFTSIDSIKSFTLPIVIVKGNFEKEFDIPTSFKHQKVTLSQHLLSTNIANILSTQSGIFTKSYGAEGSLQTISIRGTGSEYTTVYVNGINLNSTLSGVFDFSRFSSDEISEILIKKGNDFDAINHATIGSSIELVPFSNNDSSLVTLKFLNGSSGLFGSSIRFDHNLDWIRYSLHTSTKFSRNDYKYNFQGKTFYRENAEVRQNNLSGWFENRFLISGKHLSIRQFIHFINKNQGLPTFVATNRHFNSKTRKSEKTFFYSLRSKLIINENLLSESIFGLHSSENFIDDPIQSINLITKSFDLKENSYNIKSFLTYTRKNFSVIGGLSFSSEKFQSKEIKNDNNVNHDLLSRNFLTGSIQLNKTQPIKSDNLKLRINSLLTYNHHSNEKLNFINWRVGTSLEYEDQIYYQIYANTGKSYRIPNFYEKTIHRLTSLKNETLRNENIQNSEIGIKLAFNNSTLEITYFNYTIENKIIWIPQRVAFFAPRNKGKIKSSGVELNVDNIRINRYFLLSFNYTFNNALNKNKLSQTDNSYNKQLIYIPKHKSSISIFYEIKSLLIELSATYFSRRYYTEDNDELFSLEPVLLSNASLLIKQKILGIRLNSQFSILNLFNQSYYLIQSFPMPGREYRLTIQMEVI